MGAAELISGGTLQRWFASGVLRQQLALDFLIARHLSLLVIGLSALGAWLLPQETYGFYCQGALGLLAVIYVVWRLKT
jgi:hypothetical protein